MKLLFIDGAPAFRAESEDELYMCMGLVGKVKTIHGVKPEQRAELSGVLKKAHEMRLAGDTWEEIAQACGMPRTTIMHNLKKTLGTKHVGSKRRKQYKKTCDVCGIKVRGIAIHKIRAHENRNWSTRSKGLTQPSHESHLSYLSEVRPSVAGQ